VDFLEIAGDVGAERAAELSDMIWGHIPETHHLCPEMIGGYWDGSEPRRSYPLGLTQLLIVYHMLHAARAARGDSHSAPGPGAGLSLPGRVHP
jgi:phosphoribulokinase